MHAQIFWAVYIVTILSHCAYWSSYDANKDYGEAHLLDKSHLREASVTTHHEEIAVSRRSLYIYFVLSLPYTLFVCSDPTFWNMKKVFFMESAFLSTLHFIFSVNYFLFEFGDVLTSHLFIYNF